MTNQADYFVLSVYYGIDTLAQFCKTGTVEHRRVLSKQMVEHDVLTIIYDVRTAAFFVQPFNQNPVYLATGKPSLLHR